MPVKYNGILIILGIYTRCHIIYSTMMKGQCLRGLCYNLHDYQAKRTFLFRIRNPKSNRNEVKRYRLEVTTCARDVH